MIRGLIAGGRVESTRAFEPLVRERLFERFTRATQCPVTIVVAPAGFGKSVAIRHFISASGIDHLRFSVRKEQAGLEAFLRGFVELLESISPRASKNLGSVYQRALKSDSPITELANWLAALLKEFKGAIVIDDLQTCSNEVTKLLSETIDRCDESTRWILASRDPLQLPIATWLAYGRMDMPIDEVDLRFTVDEALAVAQSVGTNAPETDVRELWSLSEGWPTAFAFSLRIAARTQDFKRVAAGTREMIYSYLAEQIFDRLDEADQQVLLDTAVLPAIDLRAFSDLGRDDAALTIARLQKLTAFISADSDHVYRYHELFRDFLEHQLRMRGKAAYNSAVDLAAGILEETGQFTEALGLYTKIGACDNVAKILAQHGTSLIDHGAIELVDAAIAILPPSRRNSDSAVLALSADLKAFKGANADAQLLFRTALALAEDYDAKTDVTIRLASVLIGRLKMNEAAKVLEDTDASLIRDEKIKARYLATIATVRSNMGELSGARKAVDEALEIASRLEDESLRALTFHKAAYVALSAGAKEDAERFAVSAVQLAEANGMFSLAARASSILVSLAHEAGDQKRLTWAISQVMLFAERAGDQTAWFYALITSYESAAERGDIEKISDLDGKLETAAAADEHRSTEALLPAFALQAAWSGDFHAAHKVLIGSADALGDVAPKTLRLAEVALYAAAANDRDAAEFAVRACQDGLARLEEYPDNLTPRVVRSRLWFSMASLILGRSSIANNALREVEKESRRLSPALRALCSLVRATYVHVETGAGHADMAQALSSVREVGLGGYARLIERLPLPLVSSSPRFAALTRTEVRVLRLLAAGGTSKSIGADLGRSPQTVDSHVKAIIRKVGCSGRQEAVSLARQHGII